MVVVEAVVLVDGHPVAAARALGDLLGHLQADVEELRGLGEVDVLGSAHGDGLEPLVAHDDADAARRAGVVVVDRGHPDPVLAGEADRGHLDLLILQLLLEQVAGFRGACAAQMGRVADLDLVVVDVEVNQIRRLAANDDLVVAGVLQLRPEEAAEERMRHQVRLRREAVDARAVRRRHRRAVQQAGAEDQQVVGRERIGIGRNPVPEQLGGGALSAEVMLGELGVGGDLLDAAPGKVDLQVVSGFCVSHGVSDLIKT
jgi:hypothetical protein